MTQTLTTERLKALLDELKSWQYGYDPVDDKEQFDMLATAEWAVIELLANREAQPVAYNQVQRDMMKDILVRKLGGNLLGEKLGMADIHAATMELIKSGFRLYTAPPAPAVPDDVQRDADRWRAMLGSARIRILGADGFGATGLPGSDPDYRHFGMEIWTHYPGWLTEKNEYGIDILTKYADICRAAMLAQPVSGGYTLPEGFKLMPLEITDEIAEAIAMEARCCGGIALCIYEAALAAAPEGGNG